MHKKVTKKYCTISVKLIWLWWTDAPDQAHCRIALGVGFTAMRLVWASIDHSPWYGLCAAQHHGRMKITKIGFACGSCRIARKNGTKASMRKYAS